MGSHHGVAGKGILDNVFEMKFELGEIEMMISGDLAIVVVEENLTQRGYDGAQRVNVLATNVFERVGNAWFMVMHHGSPVFAAARRRAAAQLVRRKKIATMLKPRLDRVQICGREL